MSLGASFLPQAIRRSASITHGTLYSVWAWLFLLGEPNDPSPALASCAQWILMLESKGRSNAKALLPFKVHVRHGLLYGISTSYCKFQESAQ